MSRWELVHADCRDVMAMMGDGSVDSVVCDPPYHLTSIVKRFGKEGSAPAQFGTDGAYARASRGFMGQEWDGGNIAFDPALWTEVLRVLKPGGHLLAFSGSRTYHRMAVAIEDAGFEIRDQIMWLYGSGFPKSLDVSKALDKAAGAERTEQVGVSTRHGGGVAFAEGAGGFGTEPKHALYAPATDAARQWQGWGTALKPAHEPIVLARKPLAASSVAANVLAHGTGGINIDGCRVGAQTGDDYGRSAADAKGSRPAANGAVFLTPERPAQYAHVAGRFPANVIHDGSDEVVAGFPETTSGAKAAHHVRTTSKTKNAYGERRAPAGEVFAADSGSAARFFYCAKASKRDREEGCAHLEPQAAGMASENSGQHITRRDEGYEVAKRANHHPTVKPTDLMRYLCRLVTPPGGLVFDPFAGSGSTGKAAMLEGFRFVGAEMTAEYIPIARARIAAGLTP